MPARAWTPDTSESDGFTRLARKVMGMPPGLQATYLAQLSDSDRAIVEQAIAKVTNAGWRSNPALFGAHLDPVYFKPWPYLQLLGRKFMDGVEGRSTRQIWNLPSRMAKTTLLRKGVGLSLSGNPRARWIYTTHGDDLSREFGVGVRDDLAQHVDELGITLRRDVRRQDRFMTMQGGGLLCRSFGGQIIGFGCGEGGGLIIDDPMKGWQEAHSESKRQAVFDTFIGVLRHRLDDEDAPIFVVHTRWHLDDLSGRLQKSLEDETGEAWETVAIPALATGDPDDPLGREEGEPIEPGMFTRDDVLARRRGLIDPFVVAAIEQQDPQADEGLELLRSWFVLAESAELPTSPDQAITSWDLKLKNKEAGDYVVGQAWWKVGDGYWLMDCLRGQYDHGTTACAIALLAVRNPGCNRHVIETAGSYDDVVPELRKPIEDYEVSDEMAVRLGMNVAEREAVSRLRRTGMGNLVDHTPVGDKSVRARTYIAPKAEAGLVRMPGDAPWVPALLTELAAFGRGSAHDDQVDAMSQALQRLGGGPAAISAPSGQKPDPPSRTGRVSVGGSVRKPQITRR